ncbi:MAG: hypothetical protein DMG78_10435 [Acidobacteria bacterium]|nr:MAG: hypothetical protein DMG78_10435 [Acidobacteriota bacterium]
MRFKRLSDFGGGTKLQVAGRIYNLLILREIPGSNWNGGDPFRILIVAVDWVGICLAEIVGFLSAHALPKKIIGP